MSDPVRSCLGIDLVPDSAGEYNKLVRIVVHLEKASTKVVALLAGVIDVVDPQIVLFGALVIDLPIVLNYSGGERRTTHHCKTLRVFRFICSAQMSLPTSRQMCTVQATW